MEEGAEKLLPKSNLDYLYFGRRCISFSCPYPSRQNCPLAKNNPNLSSINILSVKKKKIKFLKWISGPCNVWGVPAVRTFFKSNWWLTHNYFFLTTLHQLMIFLYLINNYIYLLICICFFNSVKETSDEK